MQENIQIFFLPNLSTSGPVAKDAKGSANDKQLAEKNYYFLSL